MFASVRIPFILTLLVTASNSVSTFANDSGFNQLGNILISDQFNNRVIEVN